MKREEKGERKKRRSQGEGWPGILLRWWNLGPMLQVEYEQVGREEKDRSSTTGAGKRRTSLRRFLLGLFSGKTSVECEALEG